MRSNKGRFYLYLIFFFLSGITTPVISQTLTPPRFYTGVEIYNRDLFFREEGYAGFFIGSEIFSVSILAPEIEVGYFSGGVKYEETDIDAIPSGHYEGPAPPLKSYTVGTFDSWAYSIAPKLAFGDSDFRFFVLPKYSFASTTVKASYHVPNNTKEYFQRTEWDEERKKQSYFTIGVGIEGHIFETNKLSFALTMQYNGWNIREAFQTVDVKGLGERKQGTKAIGFGLRLYFNPFLKD